MRKVFRLSLDIEKDRDVIEYLDRVPKTMRGMFLADLIRRYCLPEAIAQNIKIENPPATQMASAGLTTSTPPKSKKPETTSVRAISKPFDIEDVDINEIDTNIEIEKTILIE